MCFSAEASFAVSAVLLPADIYCTRAAIAKRLAYLPLGIIPLVFSVQQLTEGFVWVGLASDDAVLARAASLSFLAVALVVWCFFAAILSLQLCFTFRGLSVPRVAEQH